MIPAGVPDEVRAILLDPDVIVPPLIWLASDASAGLFCPSVRCLFVDGRDAVARERAWAATDVFTSLVDNFQETFGLTPIEAMC
jgi:hypothetical protein